MLNQIIVMGLQLQHDVTTLDNHKYIAHQLALLYVGVVLFVRSDGLQQGVIQTGGSIKNYKEAIEVHNHPCVYFMCYRPGSTM